MGDRYSQVPPSRTNERGSAHHHQQHPSQRQRFPEDTPNFNERPVKSVPPPAVNKPTDAEFFLQDEHGEMKPNHAFLKEHFFREGRLQEEHALYILEQTTKILSKEPNMVHVRSPVTVCGDIHGQYYDLMKLFEVGGPMADNTYLFLGDYVDRGDFGIECLLYLYALKIWNPTGIILLRGNHECRHLTEYFTFKRECLHKYSERVYEACIVSFCALPITALIDNRFFCVHGGISPQLVHLSDVDAVCLLPAPPLKHLISCRSRLTVSRSQVPMACYVTCFGRTLCQTTVMSTSRPLMDQGLRPARHSCITKRADAHSSSPMKQCVLSSSETISSP